MLKKIKTFILMFRLRKIEKEKRKNAIIVMVTVLTTLIATLDISFKTGLRAGCLVSAFIVTVLKFQIAICIKSHGFSFNEDDREIIYKILTRYARKIAHNSVREHLFIESLK